MFCQLLEVIATVILKIRIPFAVQCEICNMYYGQPTSILKYRYFKFQYTGKFLICKMISWDIRYFLFFFKGSSLIKNCIYSLFFLFTPRFRESIPFNNFFCPAIQYVGSQFPNQGLHPFPLKWGCGILTTGLPEKYQNIYIILCV